MLKLFAEHTKLPGPVVAMRWCVDKGTIDKLKELGITRPWVLLTIAHETENRGFDRVDQKVVPLDQAMEYIEFGRSGKHRVFGCLVWARNRKAGDDKKELAKYFWNYNYHTQSKLIDEEGNFNKPITRRHSDPDLDHGSIDIVVPKGHFAKEPAAWEKWWVNLWYESAPKNQCQFRKRRMLAYSLQPLVVLPYALLKSLVLLAEILLLTLCGIRETKYGAFLHPFKYGLGWDCVSDKFSSVFLQDSSGKDRHPIFFLFIPIVQIALLILAGAIKFFLDKFGLGIGSVLTWLLAINTIILLAAFAVNILGGLDKIFPPESEEKIEARRKLELERMYAEYDDMVCSGTPMKAGVSYLPPKRKTFYLRFQELKSKVCLPYAK